jgi:hypothetical protein
VFLPPGDGVQGSRPPNEQMTTEARRRTILNPDKAKNFEADVFLFVLDERVPDEGACAQLVIAHSRKVFSNTPRSCSSDSAPTFV